MCLTRVTDSCLRPYCSHTECTCDPEEIIIINMFNSLISIKIGNLMMMVIVTFLLI